MRTISAAMLAHLAGDTRTLANMWKITRQDGNVYGFTDHDVAIEYGGVLYGTLGGFSSSQLEITGDLSTSNAEMMALFDNGPVNEKDIIGGLWNNAMVQLFMVNYMDLTMGQVTLASGYTGQFKIMNGKYVSELRGLAQLVQQDSGQIYSPTCRASLGDSRCTINLAPYTYNGTVTGVGATRTTFFDTGLTQAGPVQPYTDNNGLYVPTTAPYTVTAVPPAGGAWVSDIGVKDVNGNSFQAVTGAPNTGQYSVTGGLYTFNLNNYGQLVYLSFNYAQSYFAYGTIKFLTGQNAGYSQDIKMNALGSLTLALPMPNPIAVGDTYTAIAGCDRQISTCIGRFNNVIHFRGEPFIPGMDNMVRLQTN